MARSRNEIELDAVEQEMARKAKEIQGIWAKSDEEDRGSTPEETGDVNRLYKHIEEVLKPRKRELEDAIEVEKRVKDVSRAMGREERADGGLEFRQDANVAYGGAQIDRMMRTGAAAADWMAAGGQVKSLGAQFIESQGYRDVMSKWKSGRFQFSTGFEVKAGTLTEGAGLGAGLIPVPQVIPGVVQTLFQRRTVEDLLLPGVASTNSVRYIVEGTATNSAAAVAEGGAKPGSTLGTSTTDESVRKIATTLVVTDEMLEDPDAVQSYINGRLSLFVMNRCETSIVSGAGAPDLTGLTARSINTVASAGPNNADGLFKAMNGQRGSAQMEPDWILMNPANWQTVRLLRDSTGGTLGAYLGGGPFFGAYGQAGAQASSSNQVEGPNDYLWGKPVYVTTAVGSGTALIGTRAAAQVFSRGGLNVEASNAGYINSLDLFTSNQVAIRAERRLALAVYRLTAFTVVSSLT